MSSQAERAQHWLTDKSPTSAEIHSVISKLKNSLSLKSSVDLPDCKRAIKLLSDHVSTKSQEQSLSNQTSRIHAQAITDSALSVNGDSDVRELSGADKIKAFAALKEKFDTNIKS